MPPEKHALLSASSASRWLKCTAAPRFEEGLPENTSEYAEEGRLAHAIGELKVLKKCTPMSTRTYNTRLNKLKKNPLYDPEMDKTTDLYLEHITEQVMAYDTAPTVAVEVQVDFSDYVPGALAPVTAASSAATSSASWTTRTARVSPCPPWAIPKCGFTPWALSTAMPPCSGTPSSGSA